jgi:hypothetical protein
MGFFVLCHIYLYEGNQYDTSDNQVIKEFYF